MHPKVRDAIESLHPAYERLMASAHLKDSKSIPETGIYLFSEGNAHLYVGRGNPRQRHRDHCAASSLHNKAAFAMLLAREETQIYATYLKGEGAKTLMNHEVFRPAFDQAKLRIAKMDFRAINESDNTRQALLEIYVAVALSTKYNDFGTH